MKNFLGIFAGIAAVALAIALVVSSRTSMALEQSASPVRASGFKHQEAVIRATILAMKTIARAVKEHALANRWRGDTWKRVDGYIDEIVPFFNILPTTRSARRQPRGVNFFYRSQPSMRPGRPGSVPKDAIVIY